MDKILPRVTQHRDFEFALTLLRVERPKNKLVLHPASANQLQRLFDVRCACSNRACNAPMQPFRLDHLRVGEKRVYVAVSCSRACSRDEGARAERKIILARYAEHQLDIRENELSLPFDAPEPVVKKKRKKRRRLLLGARRDAES